MNTFGKILVVCNLLAVLAAIGFLMAVGPRQVKWKEVAEAYQSQLLVAQENSKAKDGDVTTLNQEAKNRGTERDSAMRKLLEAKEESATELLIVKAKVTEWELKATEAALNTKRVQAESERKDVVIEGLTKSLQKSEQDNLVLQDSANKARKEMADYKVERDTTQSRNINLAELLRQKEKVIAELTKGIGAGTGTTTAAIARSPNDPNPPPVKVKGEIMQVSRDVQDGAGTLVKLSVGIDHGVSKNHTLDVYRTYPTPEYLGRVRIIDVTERDSVGRLVNQGVSRNATLRVGDLVVDTIASLNRQ